MTDNHGHVIAAVGAGVLSSLADSFGEGFVPWVARTFVLLAAGFVVRFGDRWIESRFQVKRPESVNDTSKDGI